MLMSVMGVSTMVNIPIEVDTPITPDLFLYSLYTEILGNQELAVERHESLTQDQSVLSIHHG